MTSEEKLENKNLLAIKRIDPHAEALMAQPAISALYEFDVTQTKWQKTDVDGPLFVYKRTEHPLHSLMIANRQSLKDFIEPISVSLKLRYEPPYIFMYRKDGSIKALWFHDKDECERIYSLLVDLSDPSVSQKIETRPQFESVSNVPPESSKNDNKPSRKTKETMGYKSENKPSTSKKSESATPQKENIRNKQQIDSKISQKVILNESRPERNATPSKVSSDNSQKVLQQKNVGERKNLNAITRIDPFADSVITQSSYTALFDFDTAGQKWEKTRIDGALFVYKRLDFPLYSFMIANRQSLEDFIQPIINTLKLKLDTPYIFVYKPDGEIKGLWFHDESECKRMFGILSNLLSSVTSTSK
ncbi:dcp1-like decapping family domain-containing protein [Ditylenchus destructor]|uniref:Dcp1-like decapping family domain-containing protein n=1 Tax=Ditylenchus destructor TaxID=166010 RepID=A0AAD4N569_9BILA|nr:dcp1-like decapping family domain-containing protein [Ditylenchus destructor]